MSSLIEIVELSKDFGSGHKKVKAVDRISFSIAQGDIFGIIGLSGAGKSTLIRLLASLGKPTSGHIFFKGQDISKMEGSALTDFRKKIGMIFQHFNLLSSRTVAGNIAYALEIAGVSKDGQKKRVGELLQLVGLENKHDAYPSHLSGGEKQRVGIARALANQPEVLFCDEATSALDPKTTKEILALLKKLNITLGITIVLITHEMEVVKQICNKAVVIEKGEIVEEGPIVRLITDPKHATTKTFLQNALHDIPQHFIKPSSPDRKLLRLRFKGEKAEEPIIARMIKKYNVDANILMGWIDSLQTVTVGTLIVELTGKPEEIASALTFLKENNVSCEVI